MLLCAIGGTLLGWFARTMIRLDAVPRIAASAGAACDAGSTRISPVLAAMGVSSEVGLGADRFSLGRETTKAEIEATVEMLVQAAGFELP